MVVQRAAAVFDVSRLAIAPPVAVDHGADDVPTLAVANFARIVVVENLLSILINFTVLLALCKYRDIDIESDHVGPGLTLPEVVQFVL